jgi:hypothetical protein
LNSASLGDYSDTDVRDGTFAPGDKSPAIAATFESIRRWVRQWTDYPDGSVALLDSTTAACDAAMLALAADRDVFLYTSHAHPTIRQSVRRTAELVGRIRRQHIVAREVDLDGLNLGSQSVLADAIADRIAQTVGTAPAVVVLEHVTYKHGLHVPIAQVLERLAERRPLTKVIIDGAQAVGIWRPPSVPFAAYLGCFHKFVCAQPGTAFLLIDPQFGNQLQAHVKAVCDLPRADTAYVVQTLDLEKWNRTAEHLAAQHAISGLSKRQNLVRGFNDALDAALFPRVISLGRDHDPALRSHISSVPFASADSARAALAAAARNGYVVQQIEDHVRITAGRDARREWGTAIGRILDLPADRAPDPSVLHQVDGRREESRRG